MVLRARASADISSRKPTIKATSSSPFSPKEIESSGRKTSSSETEFSITAIKKKSIHYLVL